MLAMGLIALLGAIVFFYLSDKYDLDYPIFAFILCIAGSACAVVACSLIVWLVELF